MAKKPTSASKSKPAAKTLAKKASPKKPDAKARKWDSASLLVWPGLALLIVGEVAARVSPAWAPWLAPAGYVYGLAYPLLAVGTVWRLTSFRWLKSLGPLVVLLLTWPSFSHVFSVGLSKPEVTVLDDSFEVKR